MNDTKNFMKAAQSPDDDGPRTLVHEIMQSKLPPEEKTFERVFEEVSTTTGAGFETTGTVIRTAVFHIYTNTNILQKLRDELSASAATSGDRRRLETLEQLPYLTATIMEAMRLAPAIATRSARVCPDRDLVYAGWGIPAGTPVGMTAYLLHLDEVEYPDPMRFDPDRWMDPNPWRLGDRTFVPFSKGRRNCLGMQ